MRLRRSWRAGLTGCCSIQRLTQCFFDSEWCHTGCSHSYHRQLFSLKQSHWCLGCEWAPWGYGMVGLNTSGLIPQHTRGSFVEEDEALLWETSCSPAGTADVSEKVWSWWSGGRLDGGGGRCAVFTLFTNAPHEEGSFYHFKLDSWFFFTSYQKGCNSEAFHMATLVPVRPKWHVFSSTLSQFTVFDSIFSINKWELTTSVLVFFLSPSFSTELNQVSGCMDCDGVGYLCHSQRLNWVDDVPVW